MNKQILIIIIVLCIIPIVSSATIPSAKRGDCIELTQTCDNCTFINITTIRYPNTTVIENDLIMTQDSTEYNYTFCDTQTLGTYTYKTEGDPDGVTGVETITFEITGTGFDFTEARSLFYISTLGLFVFFFIITLIGLFKISTKDLDDQYGNIVTINHLKYLRPILFIISWVLLLAITFTSSNVAMAYLGSQMLGSLLFTIYKIMFIITLPMIFIWFIFLLIQIFRDKEMKRMIERGADIPG